MTTNVAIITRSLRLLGVLSEGETASADQGSECLQHLNMMLEQWTENDIELGYFAQTSTAADCPIPLWAESGVVSKLAQRLQAIYPAGTLAPWVMNDSENGYGTIARRCLLALLQPSDMSHMPQGAGSFGRTEDITS